MAGSVTRAPAVTHQSTSQTRCCLKPQAESLLFAAVLLLLQPVQTEVVDPVFQIVGLTSVVRQEVVTTRPCATTPMT